MKCRNKAEREEYIKSLSHDERIEYANRLNWQGNGLIVSGIGCFAGLTGGLWGSIGPGAIGVGIGSACGLWAASCWSFSEAKFARKIDGEMSDLA